MCKSQQSKWWSETQHKTQHTKVEFSLNQNPRPCIFQSLQKYNTFSWESEISIVREITKENSQTTWKISTYLTLMKSHGKAWHHENSWNHETPWKQSCMWNCKVPCHIIFQFIELFKNTLYMQNQKTLHNENPWNHSNLWRAIM